MLVLKAAAEVEDVRLKWHKIVHFGTVDQRLDGLRG